MEVSTACLPWRVVVATLAIEDRRFGHHPGVDLTGIGRAVVQNWRAGKVISGASTIAMQVARLQNPGPRTIRKKGLEALTALLLVDRHGRDAVLAHYLRLAPYGNNVHGIGYAARRYFDKPVADLSWAQTALLVALPQAPGRMNLYTLAGRARAEARAVRILDVLSADGSLGAEEHAAALEELSRLELPPRPVRPKSTMHAVLALDGALDDHPSLVRTTLDLELQGEVQYALRTAVVHWAPRGAGQAAAVVVDRRTMEVHAAVGSTRWGEAEHAGSIDFSRTPRTPGSTLKPLLYTRALDRGILRPDRILDDLQRGPDGIANADHRFLGPLLPRQALANSRNVPAVRLAQEVGLDDLSGLWERLGLHGGERAASHYGLGLAIGGMPVRLVDLVAAYGALANDGMFRPLVWSDSTVTQEGVLIFAPEHARLVGTWLSDPMARLPTFPRAGWTEHPFPAAIKTGTSEDYRDSWAVGWTEDWIVGVWVGHPDWRPMRGLSGYSGGGRLLGQLLRTLHADELDGLSNVPLAPPDGWSAHSVCPLTGHRATALCDGALTEFFPPEGGPVHDCRAHQMLGGRVVVDLPPRYAAWLVDVGLPRPPHGSVGTDVAVSVQVVSPTNGARLIRDPEIPSDRATIELRATVEPAVDQVVWYVDGEPFAVVGHPYVARWPLRSGAHTLEAGLPWRDERSARVTIEAR